MRITRIIQKTEHRMIKTRLLVIVITANAAIAQKLMPGQN